MTSTINEGVVSEGPPGGHLILFELNMKKLVKLEIDKYKKHHLAWAKTEAQSILDFLSHWSSLSILKMFRSQNILWEPNAVF